jgi:hypothetical protein
MIKAQWPTIKAGGIAGRGQDHDLVGGVDGGPVGPGKGDPGRQDAVGAGVGVEDDRGGRGGVAEVERAVAAAGNGGCPASSSRFRLVHKM